MFQSLPEFIQKQLLLERRIALNVLGTSNLRCFEFSKLGESKAFVSEQVGSFPYPFNVLVLADWVYFLLVG